MVFESYQPEDHVACLALFDTNCPEYFAYNERSEYVAFLARVGGGYTMCRDAGGLVGAFGIVNEGLPSRVRLNFIMIDPNAHRSGYGGAIMREAVSRARQVHATVVDIAASHKSAAFFARFGARAVNYLLDGWGPGMHRIDMELRIPVVQ